MSSSDNNNNDDVEYSLETLIRMESKNQDYGQQTMIDYWADQLQADLPKAKEIAKQFSTPSGQHLPFARLVVAPDDKVPKEWQHEAYAVRAHILSVITSSWLSYGVEKVELSVIVIPSEGSRRPSVVSGRRLGAHETLGYELRVYRRTQQNDKMHSAIVTHR